MADDRMCRFYVSHKVYGTLILFDFNKFNVLFKNLYQAYHIKIYTVILLPVSFPLKHTL